MKRELTAEEVAEIRWYADNYVGYRLDYMAGEATTPDIRPEGRS